MLAQTDISFVDQLVDSFQELGRDIGEFIPKLIVAILLLIIGNWIAKWVRRILVRVLDRVGAEKLVEASGLSAPLSSAGWSGVALIGTIIWFLIMVIFVQLAAEVLGINQLTALLDKLIAYIPLVAIAILIIFVAGAIANFVSNFVRPFAEARGMPWIDNVVKFMILFLGVLAALDTLNFAPEVVAALIDATFRFIPAAIAIAFAVAFGVGGIDTAKQWWAKYLAPKQ